MTNGKGKHWIALRLIARSTLPESSSNDGKRLICIIFPLKFLENLMMWRNSYGKGIDNGKGSGSYEGHDG